MIAALRLWRQGLIGALLIALAGLWVANGIACRRARVLQQDLEAARTMLARSRAEVRTATALAKARDAAHAATVERNQQKVSLEVQNDYSKQLADLRGRYDALRLRAATAATDPRSGRGAPVPGISQSAGSADAAPCQDGLPSEDALIASEQALRLKSLQDWLRSQETLSAAVP